MITDYFSLDSAEWFGTPPELREIPTEIDKILCPKKSIASYETAHQKYNEWQSSKKTTSFSKGVILSYFGYLTIVQAK